MMAAPPPAGNNPAGQHAAAGRGNNRKGSNIVNRTETDLKIAASIAGAAAAIYRTAGETIPNRISHSAAATLLTAAERLLDTDTLHHDQINAAIMLTILADKMTGQPEPVAPEVAAAARRALAAARRLAYAPPTGFATLAAREHDPAIRGGFDEFAAIWVEYNQ